MSRLYEVSVIELDDPVLVVAQDADEARALVARKGIGLVGDTLPVEGTPNWDWKADPVCAPPKAPSNEKWPQIRLLLSV
ncbi:MAG TPA: hypothetical protein EYQ00_07845, partial [Dehalococcoidia bacterium]|nr:hypothetical protein [Dehalococcoidia bacterium]